jgi:hypothetical protein
VAGKSQLNTQSPQVHLGDVQFVTAVRRPELNHLRNVVVFSWQILAGGVLWRSKLNHYT